MPFLPLEPPLSAFISPNILIPITNVAISTPSFTHRRGLGLDLGQCSFRSLPVLEIIHYEILDNT
jgi:hypothetical protein